MSTSTKCRVKTCLFHQTNCSLIMLTFCITRTMKDLVVIYKTFHTNQSHTLEIKTLFCIHMYTPHNYLLAIRIQCTIQPVHVPSTKHQETLPTWKQRLGDGNLLMSPRILNLPLATGPMTLARNFEWSSKLLYSWLDKVLISCLVSFNILD